MLENHQRPWTTCFISMNSQGQGVKYDHFLSGFGAESTFHHALTKHTIVAIQKSLTQSDPQLHAIKEKCYAIDIENADALAQLQSKLARGGQSSLVTLCDYAFFCALADANTVDECRTYMALTELPSFQPSPISMGEHTNTVPSLLGWKVTSTHIFDAGVLIQIRRANQWPWGPLLPCCWTRMRWSCIRLSRLSAIAVAPTIGARDRLNQLGPSPGLASSRFERRSLSLW